MSQSDAPPTVILNKILLQTNTTLCCIMAASVCIALFDFIKQCIGYCVVLLLQIFAALQWFETIVVPIVLLA